MKGIWLKIAYALLDRSAFVDFLEVAHRKGFISDVFCVMHDGIPFSEDEDEEMIEGFDPCVHVVRIHDE